MNLISKTYIVYHRACTDGFMSAYIANIYFSQTNNCDVEFVPTNPGETPYIDRLDNSVIIMIDVVIPRDDLIEWNKRSKHILVLDHHDTARKKLSDLSFCKFDMTKCGATMAWEHFFPSVQKPWWVIYNEDRDLGRIWNNPELCQEYSKYVNSYILNTPQTFKDFDLAFKDDYSSLNKESKLDKAIKYGREIFKTQNCQMQSILHSSMLINLLYEKKNISFIYKNIPIVNSPVLQSELGMYLCETYPESPFSCVYHIKENNGELWIKGSLRTTRKDWDVGIIAEELFGGGGHIKAAGFNIPFSEWLKIMNSSQIIKRGFRDE